MMQRPATSRRLSARIAFWQVAAALVLVPPATAPGRLAVAVVVGGLIAWTALPIGGRTGDQWFVARLRFRSRMRRRRRAASPVDAVIPDVETRGHADRAGNRVGLVADGPAWTAVLRLDPIHEADLVKRLPALLDELASVVTTSSRPVDPAVHDVRPAAIQLVGWSVPGPGKKHGGPTAMRTYWVAVRFVPSLDPAATRSRGGGEQGAVRAAAVAALRLAARLRGAGYGLRILDGAELTGEIGTSLGLAPPPRGGDGAPVVASPVPTVRETWRAWSLGPLHHACFQLRRPPRSRRALATVLALAPRPPAVTTSVSVLFTPDDTQPRPRCEVVIRVAVPGQRAGGVVRSAVRRRAVGVRRRVVPMHGQHLAGVRATIPLAYGLDEH